MDYGMFKREDLFAPQGTMKTKGLFREWANPSAPLTLSRHEQDGCINLRSLYISFCVDDPTELVFAEAVFGDYSFWLNLSSISWMQPHLEEWRTIVDVKRKALAFNTILTDAKSSSRSAPTSAKYLIEEPWKSKKSDKEKKEKTSSVAYSFIEEDAKRLNLQ